MAGCLVAAGIQHASAYSIRGFVAFHSHHLSGHVEDFLFARRNRVGFHAGWDDMEKFTLEWGGSLSSGDTIDVSVKSVVLGGAFSRSGIYPSGYAARLWDLLTAEGGWTIDAHTGAGTVRSQGAGNSISFGIRLEGLGG